MFDQGENVLFIMFIIKSLCSMKYEREIRSGLVFDVLFIYLMNTWARALSFATLIQNVF